MLPIRMAKAKCSEEFEDTTTPMLDPHVVVDHLFSKVGVKIDSKDVKEFWHIKRNLAKEPWAIKSPATEDHVPLALYGDSCRIHTTGNCKVLGLFISLPLWKASSTRCSRFCIWACEEKRLWKRTTLDRILQRVTYSLNLLFDGKNERGQTIAAGNKFCITELRGDWLWHRECFGFSSSWKRMKDLCYLCNAKGNGCTKSQLYYNYWDENPDWHEYNTLEFINAQLGHRNQPCTLSEQIRNLLCMCMFKLCFSYNRHRETTF